MGRYVQGCESDDAGALGRASLVEESFVSTPAIRG